MLPKPEEGTVVITANQTAGRGQRGNTWLVQPGKNLTFSLFLKPTFLKADEQFFLTIIISLAVTDSLFEIPKGEAKIKWPNDILVNGKKVCGILIENSISQSGIQQTIIGIGLNVNQEKFSMDTATSIKLISEEDQDLNSVLNLLLENIEKRYLQLRNRKLDELKTDYLNRLFGKDEQRNFLVGEKQVSGKILGVDSSGKLIVEIDGQNISFNNKEIAFGL
jgi:BirA family biotin operon repressor/biotin-[acetyl-CoA-carboxylase] ligase